MKCFIQLSKIGDIISILPILRHEFQVTGKKSVLMVQRDFASLLEGVSYVEPLIFNGAYDDLRGAIRQAKKKFSEVVVLQTHGNIPIEQSTPSFQFDQWKRGGCEEYFDKWPTVFDRRDVGRENIIDFPHFEGKPFILLGDHSQSSPFLHKEELASLLKDSFPDHQIIRLSEIKAHRIYDLLGIFDRAFALVTIETSHVHLSKASSVPTFVLAANGWRGSAWHPKFKFYSRYNEWDRRKGDLIEAMKLAAKPEVKSVPTANNGYNPSIINYRGAKLFSFRVHDRNNWKTSLIFEGEKLGVVETIRDFSVEDARLFEFDGKLHAAYVVSTSMQGQFRCYMAYGEIIGNEITHIQPRYAGNDFRGMNKNWLPFVHDEAIHFIYGIRGSNQVTLQVKGEKVVNEYLSPAPTWAWGEIRGGAIVSHGGNYLRFFHSRQDYPDRRLRYFIGASIIEAKPPFKTIAVSRKPIIEGDERWMPNVRHWKANVVIPYGAIEQDGKFLLSFGRNDSECCIAELQESDLNL